MRRRQTALLRSESRVEYNEFKNDILSALNCRNPIEELLAQGVIDESWNIARLRNAQTLIITSRARKQARLSDRADDREKRERNDHDLKAEVERNLKSEATREDALEDLREPIGKAIDDEEKEFQEVADAVALESNIENQIKIDQLIDSGYARLTDALRQIDWCRKEFLDNLVSASDAAIGRAFKDHAKEVEIESTSMPTAPHHD